MISVNLNMAVNMSDSASSHTRGSSVPGRAVTGNALQVLLVSLLGASIAVPVYAHVNYEDGHTYTSPYNCTWSRSEISHGSGGGYSKANLKSEQNQARRTCRKRLSRPIEHLRAKWVLHKKTGSAWIPCRTGHYWYNGRDSSELEARKNHATSPPCGSGEYMTMGETGVKIGSKWFGGKLSSGARGHILP